MEWRDTVALTAIGDSVVVCLRLAHLACTRCAQKLQKDFDRCFEVSEEKVALANQTYEMVCGPPPLSCPECGLMRACQVDKHIRRLDADLGRLDAEASPAAASANGALPGGGGGGGGGGETHAAPTSGRTGRDRRACAALGCCVCSSRA